MTLAPPRGRSCAADSAAAASADVSAVLVLHDAQSFLIDTLDALAQQTRAPQRLVVVDTGSTDNSLAILAAHTALARAVPDQQVLDLPRGTTFGDAVEAAVRALGPASDGSSSSAADRTAAPESTRPSGPSAGWLWLLHDDTAPDPMTLARLVETVGDSPAIAVAGPKLTTWDDPRRLLSVGLRYTRTGRAVGGPVPGESDQGQHDDRSDVLGLPSAAMLVRRDVYDGVGRFDPAFADGCADLDFSWRVHLAGYRVVVVPRAVAREGAATRRGLRPDGPDERSAARSERRRARQVALTRCALPALPFMALWTALLSLTSAAGLLLLKRPREAGVELTDLGAVLGAGRTLGARARFRGRRQVSRRRLSGVFVTAHEAWQSNLDAVRDTVGMDGPGRERTASSTTPETGPVSEDAEAMTNLVATWPQRVVRHPGLLSMLLAIVLSALTWRGLLGSSALRGTGFGLSGGELLRLDTGWYGLWHAWLDGWHGPGLGTATQPAAYLPVLAGASWLVGLLPWAGSATSSAGTAIAWLLLGAPALSVWTAYVAARVATRARWPRAWAALAWAFVGTLGSAVGAGRIGAVVAHVMLPLLVAGFALVLRRNGSTAALFATGLGLALTAVFAPPVLLLGLLGCALGLLLAPGWARLRALVLAAIPLALYGPALLTFLDQPRLLLSGPGLSVRGGTSPAPWQLALVHPSGPWELAGLLAVPVLAAGVVACFAGGPRTRGLTPLSVTALIGLALGLVAPHVVLLQLPTAAAGAAITGWPGIGLDLFEAALLGAALLTFGGLGRRATWRRMRRHAPGAARAAGSAVEVSLVGVLVAIVVLATLGAAGYAAWRGVGDTLSAATPALPAVAQSQATGPLSNRMLLLDPQNGTMTYRLVGAEPGAAARDLPAPPPATDAPLAAAVQATLGNLGPSRSDAARSLLADLGVAFVGYQGSTGDALVTHIDATGGLSRLGTDHGVVLWRVLPTGGANGGVAPSRLRLQSAFGPLLQGVASSAPNAAADVRLPAGPSGRRLVVAEPPAWARHAVVSYAGKQLTASISGDRPSYAVPPGAGRLRIEVPPTDPGWHWLQLGSLAVCVFLAVPFGRRTRRGGR